VAITYQTDTPMMSRIWEVAKNIARDTLPGSYDEDRARLETIASIRAAFEAKDVEVVPGPQNNVLKDEEVFYDGHVGGAVCLKCDRRMIARAAQTVYDCPKCRWCVTMRMLVRAPE